MTARDETIAALAEAACAAIRIRAHRGRALPLHGDALGWIDLESLAPLGPRAVPGPRTAIVEVDP